MGISLIPPRRKRWRGETTSPRRRQSPARREKPPQGPRAVRDWANRVDRSSCRYDDAVALELLQTRGKIAWLFDWDHACDHTTALGNCNASALLHLAQDLAQLRFCFMYQVR